jgi:nucleoid-associated protein YgaU
MAAKPVSAPPTGAPSTEAPGRSSAAINAASKSDAGSAIEPTQRPEFDIVRIEPSGDSVIAGRGAPGTTIALVDGGAALGRAVADARGEVVFMPPPLAPGEHVLMLQSVETGGSSVIASRSVSVVVPKKDGDAPLLALAAPAKPSVTRSDSRAPEPRPSVALPPLAPAKTPPVAIRTAEAEVGGSFFATGIAPPGSQSRLYLNGAFLAKVISDLHGLWALKIEKGMRPGNYVVRADEVEPASGKVVARAEVPFIFPAPSLSSSRAATDSSEPAKSSVASPSGDQLQLGAPASSDDIAKEAPAAVATVVKEVRTAMVARGDSLWRISRKMLGRGIRYRQIYEANESQIRDPSLVFPGQIFVMPSNPG